MKRERAPTSGEFEKLLAWIDPDREAAGHKLQLFQLRLTKSFISRGCVDAETLTDEVINRVAVRIDNLIESFPNPLQCMLGFVPKVHHEILREQRQQANAQAPPSARPAEVLEREDECLKECMGTLRAADRNLFTRYFGANEDTKIANRKALAEELNFTANAVRIQAHRLRKKLLECLQLCLERM